MVDNRCNMVEASRYNMVVALVKKKKKANLQKIVTCA